ncbi:MAG: hypothetical protein LBI29_04620 [Rickettsiales bacterium]|jgi:hypothetical protein|nr:hypothetical protein [Rickettsiales bacterium]
MNIVNATIHMSKKEGDANNSDNVISPAAFGVLENTEAVPYLNKSCDGVQDILLEVERNTLGLQKDFMARSSLGGGNVVDISFPKGRRGRKAPNI